MGERSLLATTAAMLAQAVLLQGRPDEADALSETARELADADDHATQALWRGVRARVRHDEALAREAVALVAATDALTDQADAYEALTHVLRHGGRAAEADAAAHEAQARRAAKRG